MMKHLTTILFLLALTTTFGQTVYEPQILILAPNVTKYEKAFDKEITNYNTQQAQLSSLIPLAAIHANSKIFFIASAISPDSIMMPNFSLQEAIMILLS